jgi:hypothetical protein
VPNHINGTSTENRIPISTHGANVHPDVNNLIWTTLVGQMNRANEAYLSPWDKWRTGKKKLWLDSNLVYITKRRQSHEGTACCLQLAACSPKSRGQRLPATQSQRAPRAGNQTPKTAEHRSRTLRPCLGSWSFSKKLRACLVWRLRRRDVPKVRRPIRPPHLPRGKCGAVWRHRRQTKHAFKVWEAHLLVWKAAGPRIWWSDKPVCLAT